MLKVTALIIVSVLLFLGTAIFAENPYLFRAGYGIKPLILGTVCTKDLIAALGQPVSIKYNESTNTIGVIYPDYILIVNRDLQITTIILVQSNYKDKSGIGVESTKEAVIKQYGDDYILHEHEDMWMLIYRKQGVTFIIKSEKVVAVILYQGLPKTTL